MQSGSIFRVSPRLGFVYDLSGRQTTILRGGFGIFYDRPQGNMVFGLIDNAPGMLQPTLQWGRLQDLRAASGDPDPTLVMWPTAYDFAPPKVYAWNVGLQQKLTHSIVFDVALASDHEGADLEISLAVIAEKPEIFGRTLVYLGLAEGIAIYGLVVTILLLGRI